MEKQGNLEGVPVRCVSWAALPWDYFYFMEEIPQRKWRKKDLTNLKLVTEVYGKPETLKLHQQFKMQFSVERKILV